MSTDWSQPVNPPADQYVVYDTPEDAPSAYYCTCGASFPTEPALEAHERDQHGQPPDS